MVVSVIGEGEINEQMWLLMVICNSFDTISFAEMPGDSWTVDQYTARWGHSDYK